MNSTFSRSAAPAVLVADAARRQIMLRAKERVRGVRPLFPKFIDHLHRAIDDHLAPLRADVVEPEHLCTVATRLDGTLGRKITLILADLRGHFRSQREYGRAPRLHLQ